MGPIPRFAAGLAALLLLGGCSWLPDWLGTPDEPPLPGQRVSILALDRGLTADPALATMEVSLPAPYVNPSWPQAGGTSSHSMYHLQIPETLGIRWRSDAGRGGSDDRRVLAQPLVVDGRVYTLDSRSTVTAFASADGKRVWQNELRLKGEKSGYFGGGLAYEDGRLFVSTGFAIVYALSVETGEIIWQQRVAGPMRAAPAVSGGRVFVTTIDNRTFALASDDGRRVWEHTGVQEIAGLVGAASPAVAGSVVVVPYSSGELFGLLAETGRVLWSDNLTAVNRFDPLANIAHIRGMPVIDRGIVLAISHAGRMVAIDARRGARAWDVEIGGVEMPWPAGEFIYLLTTDSQVICLTRRDGRVRWASPLPRFEDPEDRDDPISWYGPVLAGDRLIVASSSGEAITISPYTGQLLGYLDLPGRPAVSPVVADGTVYILTASAELMALR
jgi:outer membrane protein assembly factor BamB